jgi:hypothetical protein
MIAPRTWLNHVMVADLPALSYRVAIALVGFADWDGPNAGGNIRPGHANVADRIGLDGSDPKDVDRVKKALKELRTADLLYITHQSTGRGNASVHAMTTSARAKGYRDRREAGKAPLRLAESKPEPADLGPCQSFFHDDYTGGRPAAVGVYEKYGRAFCAACMQGARQAS